MLAFLLTCSVLTAGPEAIFSGPQAGEKTPPFKVLSMNGPGAGKEVDSITEWKGAPAVLCFVHELTRPAAQLIRRLDAYGMQNKDSLRTLFISLASDVQEAERRLPPSIKAINWLCPIGISVDGKEGPGAYGLNKDVLLTVIAAKDNVVVGNWAIVSPNETDFPRIQAVLDKLIEPALDSPDAMKAEILRLRAQLAQLRSEVEELKRAPREERGMQRMQGERPEEKKPLPGKAPSDPKLVEMLRRVIRVDAAPADIDQALKDIDAYVKNNADLQKQIVDAFILVDHLGYGSDYSKTARKKLSEAYKK